MDGNADGMCFAVGTVIREGSFQGGEAETGVGENLAEVGWSMEVDNEKFFRKL